MRRLLIGVLLFAGWSVAKKDGPVDLALSDMEGRKAHLKDYRGKIVVLNFWATWCGPCRDEMPMFVAVEKQWAARDVVFIGASLDEKTRAGIPEFVRKYGIDFPIWIGATSDDLARLGMGEAVPDTAFINEEGVVLARVQGQIQRAELEERLAWISSDRSGPAPAPFVRHLP